MDGKNGDDDKDCNPKRVTIEIIGCIVTLVNAEKECKKHGYLR